MSFDWNDADAPADSDPLGQCVYGSRLLGGQPDLVLHGGGNTSVKTRVPDIAGGEIDVMYMKGSGWDLATIEPAGFAPLRLDRLRELLAAPAMSDARMMNEFRCALTDASAPNPSVETLLHAFLPHAAVQHSHADAIVALTNLTDGEATVRAALGDDIVVVPYKMPGFDLVQIVRDTWPQQATGRTVAMVLLHHGLFTFGDTTREAYLRHREIIARAEAYLAEHAAPPAGAGATAPIPLPSADPLRLATLRRDISHAADRPMITRRYTDETVARFVARADLGTVSQQGPATPDHVIRTKQLPMIGTDVDAYTDAYRAYFAAHEAGSREPVVMLDPAPRVVLDPELGMVTAGPQAKDTVIAADIYRHTIGVIEAGERLGGYRALSDKDMFDMEYWELEQAKLRLGGRPARLAGQVALVTGAASGIGGACVEMLLGAGAAVIGLDRDRKIYDVSDNPAWFGIEADVTDEAAVAAAIAAGVERFGGIDIVVVSAGIFPTSQPIAALEPEQWRRTMAVNVDSVATLLRLVHPILATSPVDGSVVLVTSKNVPAPGPGAAAYSASKAALNQLGRVAALEWAADGIRVNMVHPDAVFDTGLWTDELLAARAEKYGMTVDEYKRRNLLRTEVSSATVAAMVQQMCGPAFAATTGAQVPIDGGNERVV